LLLWLGLRNGSFLLQPKSQDTVPNSLRYIFPSQGTATRLFQQSASYKRPSRHVEAALTGFLKKVHSTRTTLESTGDAATHIVHWERQDAPSQPAVPSKIGITDHSDDMLYWGSRHGTASAISTPGPNPPSFLSPSPHIATDYQIVYC
jgi:hypothetical protein